MTGLLEPVTLVGRHVALVPLARDHHDALIDAVRDGELWRLWTTNVPSPDGMADEIERRLRLHAGGRMLPFTVLDQPDGRVVGMTTFMDIDVATRGWRSVRPGMRAPCSAARSTRKPSSC